MTTGPDFEDLVGGEVTGAERDRLRRTHELLLAAGPPPELAPELEAGPTLAMTMGGMHGAARFRRRAALLLAAAIAVATVFVAGYATGNRNGGKPAAAPGGQTIALHGTAAARGASGSLWVGREEGGNWPMTLAVVGLPTLPQRGYYEVYLVRNGKPWAPCGTFVVRSTDVGFSVTLNAPYELQPGDTWVVTKQLPGSHGAGQQVLVPA